MLTDSWFASCENMDFIRVKLDKHFIMALKSNRKVALTLEDKKQGHFVRIDELEWLEQSPRLVWLKGVEYPIKLHRQIFTNKDGSTGILYLACSDLNCGSASAAASSRQCNRNNLPKTVESRSLSQNTKIEYGFSQITNKVY